MKIVHISDLHIRNFKYRDEYRIAMDDLYAQLDAIKPDLVINTGDTVHSKLSVSPELFDDVAWHCLKVSEIAPYWMILGNHDLNLKNKDRMDAISPIVNALQGRTINELKLLRAGEHVLKGFSQFSFWNYDIRGHKMFDVRSGAVVNIGLYHGSISGCMTDIGFVMDDAECEISKFDEMDYVLMGDIHKRQSFRGGRVRYPGSLIQQNYGEELVKGFLVWDITDSQSFSVDFRSVSTTGRFFTIQVPADLSLTGIDVPTKSRVRAIIDGEISLSKRMDLEKRMIRSFDPIEIIIPDSSGERIENQVPDIDELVGSRDKLMRDHLQERGASEVECDQAIKFFRQYEASLDVNEDLRGKSWQLKKFSWSNMLNYGEGNSIDISKLSGLVGIFAPNASGKSSIFDILLQALFDRISKEVPRNIDLVNDNKDVGQMLVEFESDGQPYAVERSIERIHYGQRSLVETKQWGKTSLDFSSVDESLNGTSRPETERSIREIVGSFEDFAFTTMVTQNPIFGLPGGADLLNCRETDRRKILFRFLDLDIYEQIAALIKDELKEILGKFKVDREKIADKIKDLSTQLDLLKIAAEDSRVHHATATDDLYGVKQGLLDVSADEKSMADIISTRDKVTNLHNKLDAAMIKSTSNVDLTEILLRDRKMLESSRPSIPNLSLKELVEIAGQTRKDLGKAKEDLFRQETKHKNGLTRLKTLDDIPCEGKFPSCKFIVDATSFLDEMEVVETALRELRGTASRLEGESAEIDKNRLVHDHVAAHEQRLWENSIAISRNETEAAVISSEIMSLRQDLESLEITLANLGEIDDNFANRINLLKEREMELLDVIKDSQRKMENSFSKIGAISESLSNANADLVEYDSLKKKARLHELIGEMCGKNGLPYRILTLVLPVINAEIAKILGGIVKFNVFFEDDLEEQTVSLYIRYGDYKSRPLSLGSGAEKFIASLAVRAALLSVSSLPKTDILIIDEGFGKLDPEHLESLQRMFEYLRQAFGTVFIVSHVDFMRDIVDHSIEITSQDGYAHVEVI